MPARHAGLRLVFCAVAAWLTVSALGAASPDTPFTDAQRHLWSLQPLARPAPSAVQRRDWVRNPIDAFVLAKLEEGHLRPAPPADRVTLLRRASLDLIG